MSGGKYYYPFIGEDTCKYRDELIKTANAIATTGKGILACDESTGSMEKRFAPLGIENTIENRRSYRHALYIAEGLEKYISGAILFEETLFDTYEGELLVKPLVDKGIILGIKADQGTKPLPFQEGETYTQGLTDLDVRCKKYYEHGVRFAKWRAVLNISQNCPSNASIIENAYTLARYASICQQNGLVPIVEPDISMDGEHTLEICQYWTTKVITECYKALSDYNVILEGTLLKPNMVLPGTSCKTKATPEQIARATLTALQRSVPVAVPAICFLSGGQSEEEATINLNAINSMQDKKPWQTTFSYGRALQKSAISAWANNPSDVKTVHEIFLRRCKANSEAVEGKYTGDAATSEAQQSLFTKNYTY